MEKMMMIPQELMTLTKNNVEAMMKAGKIWSDGFQEIAKTFSSMAQAQVDANMANLKALSGAKSVKDAIEIQTAHTRKSFEKAADDTGKLTDFSKKP